MKLSTKYVLHSLELLGGCHLAGQRRWQFNLKWQCSVSPLCHLEVVRTVSLIKVKIKIVQRLASYADLLLKLPFSQFSGAA